MFNIILFVVEESFCVCKYQNNNLSKEKQGVN